MNVSQSGITAIPGIILTVAGVIVVVVAGLHVASSAAPAEYTHEVDPLDETDLDRDDLGTVLQYSALSSRGQLVFRRAVADPNRVHTVTGNPPEDFRYTDHLERGSGIYYVAYQGDVYRLETRGGGPAHAPYQGALGVLFGGAVLLGLVAVVGGIAAARAGTVRLPSAVVAGGTATVLWTFQFPHGLTAGYDATLVYLLGALAIGGPAAIAWLGADLLADWAGD